MREYGKFWVIALTLLAFFCVLAPQMAHAEAMTDVCEEGNEFDKDVDKQAKDFLNGAFAAAQKAANSIGIIPTAAECIAKLTMLIDTIDLEAVSGDMFATIIIGAIKAAISAVISQVCEQAMSAINSVKNTIKSLATICLPLPSLSLGSIGSFNGWGCSGGLQIPLFTFEPSKQTPKFDSSQYLQQ